MPKGTLFDRAYKALNKEQKWAVDAIEGPVMVVAGPGTGKTQILTLRIANILRKTDTPASGILAITFTDAGVKAMRKRLREIIGARADEVRITTFHGFASSIISEFDEYFPHLADSTNITDIEAEALIRDILKNLKFSMLRPAGDREMYVQKIIGAISEAKREVWTPDVVRKNAKDEIKRIKNDDESISSRGPTKGKLKAEAERKIQKCERTVVFADVYGEYEKRKRKEKKIDFDDLIIEVIDGFKRDELLLRLIQEKFLYVLVDEHQDTNDSQNLLVRMIVDFFDNPNIFVVGDEKQAIYRFQGASVQNFLSFQNIWKNMEVIYLKSNYRSHQHILDAGFSLIENNYTDGEHKHLRVKLKAEREKTARPIDVVQAENIESEEKYLAEEIKKLEAKKATIAVIVPTNRDAERVLRLLNNHDIYASSERGIDIFSHPAGILFFDLLRFVLDESQTEFLAKTIAFGLWNLTFPDRAKIVRDIKAGLLQDIVAKIPIIETLENLKIKLNPVSYIMYVGQCSGFTKLIANDSIAVEVWRTITKLVEEITRRKNKLSVDDVITEILSYVTSAKSKSIKIGVGDPRALVSVMTVHGSKGLEFDYVFMPYSVEESWTMKARSTYFVMPRERATGDEVRDARRLFYVAITRARKHVTISLSTRDVSEKELVPLRFIGEIGKEFLSNIVVPVVKNKMEVEIIKEGFLDGRREQIDYAKRVLLEGGLSVTALNHFLTCPRQFFYKSILRLPEAPHPSSEKGNAMHEAIANVWKLKDKNKKTITETLKDSIKNYFSKKSLLPLFEKEPLVESLLEDVPDVVRCLASHFEMEGSISIEKWYEKTHGTISIHGKMDAVLEQGSQVFVFDYKTKETMSEKEIKGETKNSDGNYFRQIVFYKILLEQHFKQKNIVPALVFVRPNAKGECNIVTLPITKEDEQKVIGEIETLVETVLSGKLFDSVCQNPDCEYCALHDLTKIS